ncbi:MAG TPA: FAD-dependent oxidoreductase, partial [Thermoanaerobaculia bacterium]
MTSPRSLAIVGAGPMGLFAALEARRRGLEPTVFEAQRVGEALYSWGSARLFSPVSMNVPEPVRRLVGQDVDPDALL